VRIALLEDEPAQAELLRSWLTEAGYHCYVFTTGEAMLRALGSDSFDLMIFDWELPGMNGIEVTHRVRERCGRNPPILFVTSRHQEKDVVEGLAAGADDYMTKPARRLELFARLQALTRRTAQVNDDALEFPPYRFLSDQHAVKIGGETVQLTTKEYQLAEFLFRNAGRLLSRGHILESVWGLRHDLNTRTVDTHVSLVRHKLAIDPARGWRLATIYRHGYRLERFDATEQT